MERSPEVGYQCKTPRYSYTTQPSSLWLAVACSRPTRQRRASAEQRARHFTSLLSHDKTLNGIGDQSADLFSDVTNWPYHPNSLEQLCYPDELTYTFTYSPSPRQRSDSTIASSCYRRWVTATCCLMHSPHRMLIQSVKM